MALHIGFLESQIDRIETEVYETKYPAIQYPRLVPIDASGPPWVRSVVRYISDRVGKADFIGNSTTTLPMVDVSRTQAEVTVETAGLMYSVTDQEVAQAQAMGYDLDGEKARACRLIAEETLDDIVINGGPGNTGWDSLVDPPSDANTVTITTGTGGNTWAQKTGQEIANDINKILGSAPENTKGLEQMDTICIPMGAFTSLASRTIGDTSETALSFINRTNVYTARTGRPLRIFEIPGLEDAGASNAGRMIAYRMDPNVLRLHLPEPPGFGERERTMMRSTVVPMFFRTAGLEIRLPKAFATMDGITN